MDHKHQAGAPSLSGVTVCQVIPELEAGGAERTTLEVGRAIVEAGGRSIVVSQGGPMTRELTAQGSRHVTLPVASKHPLTLRKNAAALERLIADETVTILHARSRAPAWSALWAARAAKIPFVTTYHGIYRAKGRLKRLYNSVMARGDAVIANSAFTAEAVRESYGGAGFFNPEKMVTIPRGADLSRFDPGAMSTARRDAAEAQFGGEGRFRILLPGRLTEWKGQAVAIDAMAQLKEEGEALPHLVLIGADQGREGYRASLEDRIAAAGLGGDVRLLDHWEDMPAAFAWADLCLSTSIRPEAFGRVAIEAQAMGVPVVASAHGGALETVAHGETGLLIPPGDVAALARAMKEMAHKEPLARKAISEAAMARARANFSTQAMTDRTLWVYKGLVNG